ncbi:thiamine pyrophosphate-binding protein [Thalassotalea ponticola]|uniref:thiamine pyrophosphate-binding protein n=1 Tax=Thalassotalea ponticola TaxID=1523392 RepID=UPI0025B3E128|nr:thiamine pyrophosphate-binding protein [Thalassotalea ponticola]MDN3653946.1 thiamine pyrophosphate-binding protein [Thalassotalea ponticola]
MTNRLTVAYQLISALQKRGVKYIFGVPSGGFLPYLQAIEEVDGIEFVLTAHEGGAAFMAATVGKLTGTPGVCFATFGPGATNLSTGVGSALLDRSPLIALTDEVSDADIGQVVQMNIDHQALFAPLTKHTWRLVKDDVDHQVQRAFDYACDGVCGPVHIGLPVDIADSVTASSTPAYTPTNLSLSAQQRASVDLNNRCHTVTGGTQSKQDNDSNKAVNTEVLNALCKQFTQAKRPVIAVGLRALSPDICTAIALFAQRYCLPVVLTPMAKGVIANDHPCYVGVLFHALSDCVAELHSQADLVFAVGYDEVEFNYRQWVTSSRLIALDCVQMQISALENCDVVQYQAPIASTLNALADALESAHSHYQWTLSDFNRVRETMAAHFAKQTEHFGPVSALRVLRQQLAQDGIMSCDVGAHTHLIGQYWSVNQPLVQLMSNGWSSMGYAIPSAIAAKLCQPEKQVCAVIGDGGFLMTANELTVAKRLNLAIVFVLFSDSELALIRIKQDKRQANHYGVCQSARIDPQSQSIFGVPVVSVTDTDSFAIELNKAFAMQQPIIVEALFDSSDYNALVLKQNKRS